MVNLKELSIKGMDCDYRELDDQGKDITQCWMLREIPSQIENLKNLQTLSLPLHAIQTLPLEMAKLNKLKVLDLTDNSGLSSIDPLAELEQLEELYLFGCHLTKLPQNMSRLTRLKKLGLTGNNITEEELSRIKSQLPNSQVVY
jgi:Leucine-rich repeat (LRR) protein